MVTSVSKDKLQRIGRALHTPRVLRQARYTLALVEADPEVMAVLGRDFVSEVRAAVEALDASHLEHELARIASKEATREERDVMTQARRYRRAFVTRMVSARCRGAEVPEDATRNGTRAFNSSSLTEDLERLIDLALPIADGLANAGVSREFLQEGEEHIRRLKEASLRQELAMRTIQRDALSRRRELTASVHLALRAILNAGKSVHVGEAAKLKQYTFAILRRPVRDRDVTAAPGERSPEAQKSTGGEPGMSQSDDRETAERVLLISQRGGHNRSAGAAAAKIQDPNHQLPRKSPLVVSMSNHSQIETLLLGSQCIRALPPEYLLVARRNEALGTQSPDLPMFYQSSGIGESLAPGVPPRLPAATSGRCAYEEGRKPGKELPEGIPSSWTLPPGFMASS